MHLLLGYTKLISRVVIMVKIPFNQHPCQNRVLSNFAHLLIVKSYTIVVLIFISLIIN